MNGNKYVVLEISTWGGVSFNAEHYYGSLVGYINNEYTKYDVEKKMSKKDAQILGKKDDWDYYKAGSFTNRFDDPDEIKKVALDQWMDKFPQALALLKGHFSSAEPQEVLWVKNSEYLYELNEIWKKNEAIPHTNKNFPEINKLCNIFDKLLEKACE